MGSRATSTWSETTIEFAYILDFDHLLLRNTQILHSNANFRNRKLAIMVTIALYRKNRKLLIQTRLRGGDPIGHSLFRKISHNYRIRRKGQKICSLGQKNFRLFIHFSTIWELTRHFSIQLSGIFEQREGPIFFTL